MKKILVCIIIFFSFTSHVYSNVFDKINISGNKRISNETILDLINLKKNKKYNLNQINNFQKELEKSNFFKKVDISFFKNTININIEENPIIDFFYIQGVKNKGREEDFYEILSLGSNKIFSNQLLKRDIDIIKMNYLESGYYDVSVTHEISELENNVINLQIKVDRKQLYRINKILFIGDKHFDSSDLEDVVSSSQHGWWKFLSSTGNLNSSRIEYDKYLLKNFYLDNGFYDMQITSSEINFVSNNLANIVFSINSGKRFYFNDVAIEDNNNLSEKNKLEISKIIKKRIKGLYSKKKIQNTRDEIYNYLNINKIEFVRDRLETSKNNKNNKINLKYIFETTDKKFVDFINVKGNDITNEDVIRRNLIFSEGDAYSLYKLKKSIDNLKSTGIFKNVNYELLQKKNKELVDVQIEVEEQPTGSISAGVGVGSAGSNITSGIQERNLFGMGINLFGNFDIGTEKISLNGTLSIPDFKNTGNTLVANLFSVSTDYENSGYESKKAGAGVSSIYDLYEDISLKVGTGIDIDKIETSSKASALYKSREGDYLTNKVFYSLANDKTNSRFLPTDGYKFSFGQTLGTPLSDIEYIENNLDGSIYHQLSKNFVLNFKSGVSSVNAIKNNDIKLSDRKFLNSKFLRGFESFGVGPKDGKDHIGGNYSFYSSASSTIPNFLPEKWNAKSIIFLDTGNVWGVDYNDNIDSNKLRSSTGLSLNWISPLGPLSFTFANVITSANTDIEENFSFQIGSSF